MADKKEIAVRIKSIKEVEFSNKLNDEILRNFDEHKVETKLGFAIFGNKEDSSVAMNINVRYIYSSSEKKREFFTFKTETIFKFSDMQEHENVIKIEESTVFVSDELMGMMLNISIGATRGMISYRSASLGLPNNLVIPLVDLDAFLNIGKDQLKSEEKRVLKKNKKTT